MRLLLIEDDPALALTLNRSLERKRMQVQLCDNGKQAVAAWQAMQPDVVVLDLSLPGLDGLQVLKIARQAGLLTPVLILTARGTVGDKILGLNAGADDYLPKPFDLDELEARVHALNRRQSNALAPTDTQTSALGALRLDRDNRALYLQGEVMDLSPREFALMAALMKNPGQAVAKERLLDLVFPDQTNVQLEAIEVVVYRLRKKLVNAGVTLVTLRGLGYLLKAE
jgi:two-component system response regulator TctD